MLLRLLQRLPSCGWCAAACCVIGALCGCSLWLDWNGFTDADAGGAISSSSNGESGTVSEDSSVKESGGGIDLGVDASAAAEASDGADGNRADAAGGEGGMDAYGGDVSNPCMTHTCGGCCDSKNICNFGTHNDSCGINGGPCSNCAATNQSCTNKGTCSSSPSGFTPPSCVGGDASTCPDYCGFGPFGLQVCCRSDQTCSCLDVIMMRCL